MHEVLLLNAFSWCHQSNVILGFNDDTVAMDIDITSLDSINIGIFLNVREEEEVIL